MRNPDKGDDLKSQGMLAYQLDVNDTNSIQTCFERAKIEVGKLDVVVNNAGWTLFGPFEAFTLEQVKQQYQTNVFGLMEVCRVAIPIFRDCGGGVIVNISSGGGRVGAPFYSIYDSTKFAVEGFSEALYYELKPFGIRVKVVEPGMVKTEFYSSSTGRSHNQEVLGKYLGLMARVEKNYERFKKSSSEPEAISKVIYKAATDTSGRLRYIAGKDARALILPSFDTFELANTRPAVFVVDWKNTNELELRLTARVITSHPHPETIR